MEKRLGDKLKKLRAERGWTQQELAKRSGIKRGYLASIEAGLVSNPSVPVFLKLASAFRILPEELYQAAGYVSGAEEIPHRAETPENIINHLMAVQPTAIPLYRLEDFPFQAEQAYHAPIDYVYRARRRAVGRKMEAYVVRGSRHAPMVNDDDIIVVDREAAIDEGEMVACRLNGVPTIGKLRKLAGDLYLESIGGLAKFSECEAAAPVIELRRWLEEEERRQIL